MRPVVTAAQSSISTSNTIPVDYSQANFNVGVTCEVSAGATLTYSAQYTADNIYDSTVTPVWVDIPNMSAKTATTSNSLTIPARAVRLNVTAWTSGSVNMTVVQGRK